MAATCKIYHVLVADDDPASVDLLSRRLERYGYEVSGAHSAAEAEVIISQRQPDMILLDLRMPEVSGLDFLRRLRS
ncbi:response regulator, partial [Candidatus Sumerlaeota bacterium]|nr:response regulator [Candidatus Sumerlaeota bacterium]